MFSLGRFQDLKKVMKYKNGEEGNKSLSECLMFCVCLLFFSFGILCGLEGWEREIVGKEGAISTKWTGRV